MDTDVAIVGNGPAGLAAAAACVERGLRVTVVAVDHDTGWPATYGIWADELSGLDQPGVLAHRWEQVVVATGAGPVRRLDRAYGRIDNHRLRARLLERAAGARFLTGRAAAHDRGVVLDDGRSIAARAVIDASGHRPALVRTAPGRPPAWQVAYGVVGTFSGAHLDETLEVEHVAIPMGGPLPPRDQPVIAFGGAAAMVHPATGYQLGAALTRAPALAAALAGALDTPGADIARAGWDAVWPADLVRQRALHTFGLEALLRMDTATTQRFFEAFFDLGEQHVRGYLSGAPSVHALSGTMLALFRHAPGALRRRLVLPALGPDGVTLLQGLTGQA